MYAERTHQYKLRNKVDDCIYCIICDGQPERIVKQSKISQQVELEFEGQLKATHIYDIRVETII